MTISEETIARISKLARIHIENDEALQLKTELSAIMGWIDQLNAVDTDGIEPVRSVMDISSAWREDEVTDGFCPEKILQNAPNTHSALFLVPKVIE